MIKKLIVLSLCVAAIPPLQARGQFPERQIPVYVIARPHKTIFIVGEPILIDVEIKNELKEEIRVSTYSSSPTAWNAETLGVELPDIYRLPTASQIWLERPKIDNPPRPISGPSWRAIPAQASWVRTIDASKWKVREGWIAGKYEMKVRADKLDVDKHSWMSVTSDPITFEIR